MRGTRAICEYYRELGFFDDPRLVDRLVVRPVAVPERWAHRDLDLLELDEARVLYLDFESWGVGGFGLYAYELPRIARITRGVFSAWDIREEALDDERWGRVRLTFRTGAESHEYEIRGGNHDWIDPQLLWIVEGFLRVSPFRFHAAADSLGGQDCLLTVLSADERDRIERDRDLVFVPLPQTASLPERAAWDPRWRTAP